MRFDDTSFDVYLPSGPIVMESRSAAPGEATFPDAGCLDRYVLRNTKSSIRIPSDAIRFDVDVPGGPVLMESRSTAPGSAIIAVDSPVGRLGVTVCYDLRFPELYQRLRFEHGCEVGSTTTYRMV